MKKSVRQYSCHFCHKKVTICSGCDRGHIYCGLRCAGTARHASVKRAGRKYQANRAGKLKHAERQKRYRMRQKKIVTHHSSKPLAIHDLLLSLDNLRNNAESKTITLDKGCYFCGNTIGKGF